MKKLRLKEFRSLAQGLSRHWRSKDLKLHHPDAEALALSNHLLPLLM